MALSVFALGYTYRNFSEQLCAKAGPFKGLYAPEHVKYLVASVEEGHKKATIYFKEAYASFEKVQHLLGMYLCKKHEFELLP